jgi:hypothetical protein
MQLALHDHYRCASRLLPTGHCTFSSSHLAGLKDVDRLGQLPGAPGQQRSLRKMRQDLSWALARSPLPRSRA